MQINRAGKIEGVLWEKIKPYRQGYLAGTNGYNSSPVLLSYLTFHTGFLEHIT